MASSSEMLHYKDLTPAPRLDNKTLNKMVWRSCQLQACFNYERMQSAGWLWAMLPGLQKIHTNKEDLAASLEFTIVDILMKKLKLAVKQTGIKHVAVSD